MQAAFSIDVKQFELREVPAPEPPPEGLVLDVKACGVCGSDLRRWREGPPPDVVGFIPGHEVAGVVSAVGDNVQNYKIGDRIAIAPDVHCGTCYYCRRGLFNLCDDLHLVGITPGYPGGFAEQMALTGEILRHGIVHHIPEELPFASGALAEPCSSVLAAHEKTGTRLGDTVVVMGAGPIGCIHVAVSKARGAEVIVSEPNARRQGMAQRFNPTAIVAPDDLATAVQDLTAGIGADLVICANPVAATQTQAVEIVRKGGRVVLFGGLPKDDPTTHLDGNRIHYGEIEVVGAFSYHPTMHALALDTLARNLIDADLLITHTFPLSEITEAFAVAAGGEALKVMVVP
jgi:L-iditol 2-dehydrogenase